MGNLSKHGSKRLKERAGLPKKALARQFALALERGYRQDELTGNLKKWVVKTVFATGRPHECILYNGKCFIIDTNETLVTVINIPSNLLKEYGKLKKK